MSRPGLSRMASVKRSASAPCSATSASGSTTLPLVFDIFCPSGSRTRPVRWTVWNGAWPVKWMPVITIRATQKKRMSKPVMRTSVG